MNIDWALTQLRHFQNLTMIQEKQTGYGDEYAERAGGEQRVLEASVAVEKIVDRVLPEWRKTVPIPGYPMGTDRWDQLVEAAQRSRVLLERETELRENLGDNAPRLDASTLHPWIWDGARSLWQSDHYRDAVGAAAIKLNAETQNLAERRNKSEGALFLEVFSNDPPKPGIVRLRIVPDDGSDTFKSIHRGARDFANGLYAAIRNPISHTVGELPEVEALEQLAAFSVLARWVDNANVERAS